MAEAEAVTDQTQRRNLLSRCRDADDFCPQSISTGDFLDDTRFCQERCFRFVRIFQPSAPRKTDRVEQADERSLVDDVRSIGDFGEVLQFVTDERSQLRTRTQTVDLNTHITDVTRRQYKERTAFEREAPEARTFNVRDDVRCTNPIDKGRDRR